MPPPWLDSPRLDIDLALPPAERYAHVPDDARRAGLELLAAIRGEASIDLDSARITALSQVVRLRTGNRFHGEARALAELLGVDWKEILLANCSYDAVVNLFMCSGVLVEGEGGPVLARNMDWWPEDVLARTSTLLRFHHGGEDRFWIAGWPGSIGVVSGLSARGFALALNAVICDERPPATGFPVMLHLRRVLEDAEDFDQAVEMVTKQKLAAPCLVAIAGSENHQRVIVERTPTRHALRWAQPGKALVVTNDYRRLSESSTDLPANELIGTACGRFDTLTDFFLTDPQDAASDEALLYILSDPQVRMEITAQQMVFHPAQRRARLVAPRRFFLSP